MICIRIVSAFLLIFTFFMIQFSSEATAAIPSMINAGAIEFETHNFTNQFSDPKQEITKGAGKIAFGATGEGYDIVYKYNDLPKYRKAGTVGYKTSDYADGNLKANEHG